MKYLLILAQIACAALFVLWAVSEISWENLKATLPEVAGTGAALLLLFRLVTYMLLGLRLRILSQRRVTILQGISAAILCIGCNNILPARLGEVCKIGYIHSQAPCTIPALFGIVAVERGMDVFCLFIMAFVFGSSLLSVQPVWEVSGIVLLCLLSWIFLWKTEMVRAVCRRILPFFLQHWVGEILSALGEFQKGSILPRAGIASLCIWGGNFIHAALLANALFPLNLTMQQIGIFCVVMFGSSALFLIPGGYGLMEGTVVALLLFLGIEKTQALAVALWARVYYSLLPMALSAVTVVFTSNSFRYDIQH